MSWPTFAWTELFFGSAFLAAGSGEYASAGNALQESGAAEPGGHRGESSAARRMASIEVAEVASPREW